MALCPNRNGLSAIIKIDCLRRSPNMTAAPGAHPSFPALIWPDLARIDETPMELDRRSITRTTISKDALLFFDEQRGVLTCRVQDVTNVGAGIELHSLNLLPLDFELSFDNFHTIRECRVIWRQGDFVGVAFQN
jgi:hypothetical protein